jgi:hypothetical protein
MSERNNIVGEESCRIYGPTPQTETVGNYFRYAEHQEVFSAGLKLLGCKIDTFKTAGSSLKKTILVIWMNLISTVKIRNLVLWQT